MHEIKPDLDAGVSEWFEDDLAELEHLLERYAEFESWLVDHVPND